MRVGMRQLPISDILRYDLPGAWIRECWIVERGSFAVPGIKSVWKVVNFRLFSDTVVCMLVLKVKKVKRQSSDNCSSVGCW